MGLTLPHRAPRYLFRGEAGWFPDTKPRAGRAGIWKDLCPESLSIFQGLSKWLIQKFVRQPYNLSEYEALAVLQHYGLPTIMLDFSSDPGVAMTFAIGDGGNDYGRIAVLPIGAYHRGISVANLRDHRWAVRPQRQGGFGVAKLNPPYNVDLKSFEARTELGIRWFEFPITENDRRAASERYKRLTSMEDDPTAGFLRHHVIEYVEVFGKLPHELANWIVEKIPIIPRVYRIVAISSDVIAEHALPKELPFDLEVERAQTLRYLSREYSDDSRRRVRDWVPINVGDVVADPRTFHFPAL